jgi:hypothetical protein
MIKLSHTLSEHQDHDLKLFQRSVSISLYIRYLKQKQGHTPQAILTVRIYLSYFYFIIKRLFHLKDMHQGMKSSVIFFKQMKYYC